MNHACSSMVSLLLAAVLTALFPASAFLTEEVHLSPADWDPGEFKKYARLNMRIGKAAHGAVGDQAMISGTSGVLAVRAGLEALRQGGSAVDAALTTSLTQIALVGGCWVSYAGFMTMMYYDAESGRVYSMNAAFNTPLQENKPLTIPAQNTGIPSGRTALVPGFMAGVQAAHDRFGRLPFEAIFEPAIYIAEEGIQLSSFMAHLIKSREKVLGRLPEARRVFVKEDGSFHGLGDLFRQPELAATLRGVADQGAEYMYKGPWAKKFVAVVQREGGKITLEDMSQYKVIWSEPLSARYGEYEIRTHGFPATGGVNTVEALNLLEEAEFRKYGHSSESAEALFWLIQVTNLQGLSYLEPRMLKAVFPVEDVTFESRATRKWARRLWEKMRAGKFYLTRAPKGGHSDGVVAVDRFGNVAAVVHTINTTSWGETGMFVDGVSIPDAACFQQQQIAVAGPGNRLPDRTSPVLVFKDGKPVLAASSIGAGLHQLMIQCLVSVLGHGMMPKAAIDAPAFAFPEFGTMGKSKARVTLGAFDTKLIETLRAMGQPVKEFDASASRSFKGYWVGIWIDPKTGALHGGAPGDLNGGVLGY